MGLLNKKLAGLCIFASCTAGAMAAPLFPDVPDNHWGKDAVAALAAKGLLEGYPDGTFKGDRAASRWETAMIVARLLAKMEQAHSTFATKAELDELRKLVNALREELDALGVRVDNLEENVSLIDKRVTELERITFYGSIESRVNFHSFTNQGQNLSDPTDALINYDAAVGSATGAGGIIPNGPAAGQVFDPFAFGAFTATDLRNGTPLISGTGFTTLARLGLNIRVSDDVDAGAEFAAFTSQGNQLVDAFYGVSANYLSNPFTTSNSIPGAGAQGLNNQPFTRMTLDNFWIHHKPSNVRARVGSITDTKFDGAVYTNQYNPNAFAGILPTFGFQVGGEHELSDDESLSWEVMGNRLPDGNPGLAGAGYDAQAWGGNVAFNFHDEQGQVKLNFLRAANDAAGGNPQAVGLITGFNNNYTPWVNPNLYFQHQRDDQPTVATGAGGTGDIRPVVPFAPAFNDGVTGIPGTPNFGAIGPQEVNLYSIAARYMWENNEFKPYVRGEWGHSEYKSNKNSPVNADGNAWRLQAGAAFFDEKLSADIEYLAVDATYDPFVLQNPIVGGIPFNAYRFGENFFNQRANLYNLHDTTELPHNREGFRGKLKWKFADEGAVGLRFGFLEQRDSSLQQIRFSPGSVENPVMQIPNTPVLGFLPGFTEPVFHGFSPFTFTTTPPTEPTNQLPNQFGGVLEAPKGNVDNWAFDVKHRWTIDEAPVDARNYWSRGLTVRGAFNWTNFNRDSNLRALRPGATGIAGESVNNVDLTYSTWGINVDYDLTKKFAINAGYSESRINGHYDPYGIYSQFAIANNNTTFDNLDVVQRQPMVGFDYEVSESINWDLAATFLSTDDKVSPAVFSNPVTPGFNNQFIPQRSIHNFDYSGIMVNTTLKFNF